MYYYVLKDSQVIGRTCDKESAIRMIRGYQKEETHYLLRAEFSIIKGEAEEFIGYGEEGSK